MEELEEYDCVVVTKSVASEPWYPAPVMPPPRDYSMTQCAIGSACR
jgi:hypothetical protein